MKRNFLEELFRKFNQIREIILAEEISMGKYMKNISLTSQ